MRDTNFTNSHGFVSIRGIRVWSHRHIRIHRCSSVDENSGAGGVSPCVLRCQILSQRLEGRSASMTMTSYSYIALDARGRETRGALSVESQLEAVRRLKEMGFFPTKVTPGRKASAGGGPEGLSHRRASRGLLKRSFSIPGLSGRVKPRAVLTFTRQVATLLEAGMPLTRGLKLIQEQD